jgi:hypothetical protein
MYRTGLFTCWHGGRRPLERRPPAVDDFRVMVHIFVAVLIVGTLWRLTSYHFIASRQPHLNHLGQAMATQY